MNKYQEALDYLKHFVEKGGIDSISSDDDFIKYMKSIDAAYEYVKEFLDIRNQILFNEIVLKNEIKEEVKA